ncbi:MAG: hypothetical protein AAF937_12105 [Planctomycetota bacterium]
MELRPSKNPWHDRFALPKDSDLMQLYEAEQLEVFELLNAMIGSRTGGKPTHQWRGIAWRWTLVYSRPGEDEPWAYVIPAEGCPLVALPVPANPLAPAELKRTPAFIRDRVLHAPRVGQICWIELPIESVARVHDLEKFIDRVTEPQMA